MNAVNGSTIKILHQTQNEFRVEYENNFLVIPDGKTIVGPDGSDRKKLIVENIIQGNPTQIGAHCDKIQTVLFDSLTQSLLVGDLNGHVKQYKKVDQSFTMVKDYKNVNKGYICSSTQVGRFAIFGGNNSLVAIDICEQQIFPGLLKSPFYWTNYLQVYQCAGSNVYLSLGGYLLNDSSNLFDCLDVTLLYNRRKHTIEIFEKMNQAHALLKEKDEIINSLSLKIKQLESSLQKQVTQNNGKSNRQISQLKMKF